MYTWLPVLVDVLSRLPGLALAPQRTRQGKVLQAVIHDREEGATMGATSDGCTHLTFSLSRDAGRAFAGSPHRPFSAARHCR